MKKFWISLLFLLILSLGYIAVKIYQPKTSNDYKPNAVPETYRNAMLAIAKRDIEKHVPPSFSQKEIENFMNTRSKDATDFIVRVQIHNGKVYVYNTIPENDGSNNARKNIIVQAIKKVAPYIKGSADFLITMHDGFKSTLPIFTFARNDDTENNNVLLIPDVLTLEKLPKLYEEIKQSNSNFHWKDKLNIALWAGSTTGDPNCYKEAIAANHPIENMRCQSSGAYRLKLVRLSQLYPDIIKAGFTNYIQLDENTANEAKKLLGLSQNIKSEDHLLYKYLLVLDGNSCTYPRLAWQMASNSVVFKQNSSDTQWFYYLLEPNVHYVPITTNLNDLVEKIEYAKLHDQEMQEISENANQFVANYLTEEAMLEYVKLLIQEYANHFIQDDFRVMEKEY